VTPEPPYAVPDTFEPADVYFAIYPF
jgi:hypothetical protein